MKTIIWDVDDVLNDLMRTWLDDRSSKGRAIPYDGLTQNPPHELLGISRSEYLASLDDFRLNGKAAGLPPLPEVLNWFCQYGNKCRNIALTATPLCSCHISAEWVMRHFGRWIKSFNIVPSKRDGDGGGQIYSTKTEFLRWFGRADMVVDDNQENIAGALSLGIRAVLVPRPWNHSGMTLAEALRTLTEFVGG